MLPSRDAQTHGWMEEDQEKENNVSEVWNISCSEAPVSVAFRMPEIEGLWLRSKRISVDARACGWIGCLFGAVLNRESKQIDTSRVSGQVIDWLRGGEKEFLVVVGLLFDIPCFFELSILTQTHAQREREELYQLMNLKKIEQEDGLEWDREMPMNI